MIQGEKSSSVLTIISGDVIGIFPVGMTLPEMEKEMDAAKLRQLIDGDPNQ